MFRALVLLFISFSCASADDVFNIDRVVSEKIDIQFTNEREIQPDISEFHVVNYVLMSNENGVRKAVVTLKNLSSGSRIFQSEQMLALFADGERRSPEPYKQKFKREETISMTLSFGQHLFPVLQIYTRQ
ncbi:hypothetical protein [Shewanella atlantica]|uniref:hypothetical protein n=1 Tax=Shewanella atlantica TaxID=271099 RepID=UPI00373615BF